MCDGDPGTTSRTRTYVLMGYGTASKFSVTMVAFEDPSSFENLLILSLLSPQFGRRY